MLGWSQVVCVLTLLFDLSAVASIGSAVALLIFAMIGVAHLRLTTETGAKPWLLYLGIATLVVTFVVFVVETLVDEPGTAVALVVFVVLSVLADRFWRDIPFLTSQAPADPQEDAQSQMLGDWLRVRAAPGSRALHVVYATSGGRFDIRAGDMIVDLCDRPGVESAAEISLGLASDSTACLVIRRGGQLLRATRRPAHADVEGPSL